MVQRANWRVFQMSGVVLGLVLLGGAISVALNSADLSALAGANPATVGWLVLAVLGNLLLTGMLFWLVTLPFVARLAPSLGTMISLIAISSLLNYLPLVRPGLMGRAVYLKLRHGLSFRHSFLILAIVLMLSIVVVVVTVGLLFGLSRWPRPWVIPVILVILILLTRPVATMLLRRSVRYSWLWIPVRVADLLVTAIRLWLAFHILGHPLAFDQALLAASGSLVVRLLALTPNGLGLSEWVVASIAATTMAMSTAEALAAALVDRAVEVWVLSAVGLLAAWRLRRVQHALGKST